MGEDRSCQGPQSGGEVTTEPTRRHQFYGRRKGKALRRHHLELMEQLLPQLRVDLERPASDTETWLEIGFGGGEHLAHQAELHPDIQFIGAEPFINGVAKLLAEIERRNLINIRIHDDDARYLLQKFPDASLARTYLLYPDPWPKARQNKRRFVNAETLAHIARALKPHGLFLFASDIAEYVEWTLAEMAANPSFKLASNSAEPFENWVETRYEAKARRDGRVTRYLTYNRN
jgi:tRNA (guanine-N7-)-methyltransferase